MPDLADQSQSGLEAVLSAQIQNARNSTSKLKPLGCCHYCLSNLDDFESGLFCDSECSEDWHNEQEAIKRNVGFYLNEL